MRVCIDCRYIRERPSGIGRYVQALVERLPALAPGDRFTLWADPRASRPLSRAPNVEEAVVPAAANGLRTLLAPSLLGPLDDADVFHAPFNILGRGVRCATVTTVHDLMWLLTPSVPEGLSPATPFKALFYRDGILRALRRSRVVIAVSRATADSIAWLAPEARVRVIPHGVDASWRPPASVEAVRAELARAHDLERPYFLVVGQNSPSKNHAAVLEAFAAAALENVELVFLQRLYARGVWLARGIERLDRRAERLGVARRVRFLPPAGESELAALMQGALALVQFSRFEGFGMPALEAMACGTPVICSDIPPLREVAGAAALHVPLDIAALAGALRRLAADAGLRSDLGARGLERSRAFSWDRSAALHLEAYREALR